MASLGRLAARQLLLATAVVALVAMGAPSAQAQTVYGITASYTVVGGGSPTAPTLHYVDPSGSPQTSALTGTPTFYQTQYGSAWSVTPNPLTGSSSSERWDTSAASSGTIGGNVTFAGAYYNQYNGTVKNTFTGGTRTPLANATLSYTAFGTSASSTLATFYQTFWMDAGASWSAPNPFWSNLNEYYAPTASGTASAAFTQTVAYAAGATPSHAACAGGNPLQVALSDPLHCLMPGVVGTLDAATGILPFFGFGILGVNVAVYNKTQSIWMALVVLWVSGAAFGWLIPSYAATVGQIFLYLGFAGISLKIILRFW